MRISDWSSDVCSSDLVRRLQPLPGRLLHRAISAPAGLDAQRRHRAAGAGDAERPARPPLQRRPLCAHLRGFERPAVRGALSQLRAGLWPGEPRSAPEGGPRRPHRSEEHTSELQSLMRISYAVFCLKKKNKNKAANNKVTSQVK